MYFRSSTSESSGSTMSGHVIDPDSIPTPSMPAPKRFESVVRIASGAMGQVNNAFDRQLGQHVTVELIRSESMESQALEAFRREAEKISTLGHAAFVPILEVDQGDGWLQIISQAVSGRTLSERMASEKRMDPREAAGLVATLAEALHLLHQKGFVHGDFCQSNILMGGDGHPRLLGVTKSLITSMRSQPEAISWPLNCTPPELLRGEHPVPGPRWDVYGLGILLYEILTGQRPYNGKPAIELIRMTLTQTPTPPRRVVRSIPAVLEAICLKAMAKDPDDRYATADELAAALRDFLKPRRSRGFWK